MDNNNKTRNTEENNEKLFCFRTSDRTQPNTCFEHLFLYYLWAKSSFHNYLFLCVFVYMSVFPCMCTHMHAYVHQGQPGLSAPSKLVFVNWRRCSRLKHQSSYGILSTVKNCTISPSLVFMFYNIWRKVTRRRVFCDIQGLRSYFCSAWDMFLLFG